MVETKRGRGKKVLIGLGVIALAGVAVFGARWWMGRPTSVQSEVDWPPDHTGYFEITSRNELRSMEPGGFTPPGTVSVCNVNAAGEGESAANIVAGVPGDAGFLIYQPDQGDWEYQLYHSVEVPDTGDCVRVSRANAVDGLTVAAASDAPDMVTVTLPGPLEAGQTYMLTAGAEVVRGMVVTVEGQSP